MQHTKDPHDSGHESSKPADLLLVNAKVVTLEPGIPAADAVAVAGETILAVGTRKDVGKLAGPGSRWIDCRGLVLIPGLIDAHLHLLALGAARHGLDCSPQAASSIRELLELVRRRAEETLPGRWLRAFGYDDLSLNEGRHPTRWELDSVSPHHPVRLDHRSGHATVLNSRALQMAEIHKDTPDPVDGVIDRVEVTGEPTGLLLDAASFLRRRLGPSSDPEELEERIAGLSQSLLSYGITSVQDAGPDNDLSRWETFRGLRESCRLMCRMTMMAGINNLAEFRETDLCWGDGDDQLRLGHTKIMLTMTTGDLQPSVDALYQMVNRSHREGFPVAIHAVEQEAVAAAVQVLRENPPAPTGTATRSRDRIEHCAECPPHLVAQLAECGAMVVIRPFTDFASQRQAALDLVDRKWVLFVDADERIPEDLAMEIATFCRGDGETRAWAGANMPRRNHIVDGIPQWGGFSPDRQLRLLRPECSSYAKSPPVHEYPFIEGPIYEFQTPMIHFNYRSWKQFHAKQRHYAELDAHNADKDMVLPLLSMCRRFLRLFYYRYWQLAGWKDGWLGFKLAVLLAWYYGPLPIAVALFSEPANPSS